MCSYGPVVLGHQHPAVERAARQQAELGRLPERPWCGHGGAGRAAGGHRRARGLGHVRQERHRRDHHLRAPSPGRRPAATGSWSRRAPTTAQRPGARPVRPASRRRTGPTSATTPSTTCRRCLPPRDAGPELAAIVVSPFKHDAGFDQELVDPAFARGPARAVRPDRRGADPGRRPVRLPAAPRARAGSRSACGRTCRPGARRSPTAIRSPRCWDRTGSGTAPPASS